MKYDTRMKPSAMAMLLLFFFCLLTACDAKETTETETNAVVNAIVPTIDITNNNELYATITCEGFETVETDNTPEQLSVTLTISDESGTVACKIVQGESDVERSINNGTLTIYVLLDSMETGYSLADLIAPLNGYDFSGSSNRNLSLCAGDDLTIEAEVSYSGSVLLEGTASAVCNSLFAWKDCETIGVGCLRHLNNLRKYECEDQTNIQIIQTEDIDYETSLLYWSAGIMRDTASPPSDAFTPIENEDLLNGGAYDGNGYVLSNFVISSDSNTGLFGSVTGCHFENIVLCNPKIIGTDNTGALAGNVSDCSVVDCAVYCTADNADPTVYGVTGTSNVGGLIGTASGDTTITASFAAVPVYSEYAAGGLVGCFEGDSILSSYASGDVTVASALGNPSFAGGLIGTFLAGGVSGCYTTSDVTGVNTVGGFVGYAENGTICQCICYGRVTAESHGGSFAGTSEAELTDCWYLIMEDESNLNDLEGVAPLTYIEATNEAVSQLQTDHEGWTALTAVESCPYSASLIGNSFPYEPIVYDGAVLSHYGDWATLTSEATDDQTEESFSGTEEETIEDETVISESTESNDNDLDSETQGASAVYEITYYDQGGEVFSGIHEPNYPLTHTYGTVTELAQSSRQGYSFDGWYLNPDCSGTPITTLGAAEVTTNISLYAKWTFLTYTITYDLSGGSLQETNPDSYTVETASFTLAEPERKGYTFVGWTGTGLDSTSTSVTVLQGGTGSRSYTAIWTPVSYTISYELNGGTGSNPDSYTVETASFTLAEPEREGYTFTGWIGTELDSLSMSVTIQKGSFGSRSYTAMWEPLIYTITYDLAGGTVSDTLPSTYTIQTSDISLPRPERDNFIFIGWFLDGVISYNATIPQGSVGDRHYIAIWDGGV